jgi:hypothetical protein
MSNQGGEINANRDGDWDVRTRIVEDGWYVEIGSFSRTPGNAPTPTSWSTGAGP